VKRAAAADEQAWLVSMAIGQPRVGQFPAGSWPTQGTIGSPSTYSPAASTPMFHETYIPAMSRFTPSPPEYNAAMHEGISPALRRGPLSYGMPPPNDGVMHDMITSGSMAAVANPGFFTQEEARATEAEEEEEHRPCVPDRRQRRCDGRGDEGLVRCPSPSHPPPSVDFVVLPFDDDHSGSRRNFAARGARRHRRRACCSLVSVSIAGMWLIRSPNLCGRCFCVAGNRYFETISANAGGRLENYIPPTPVLHPIWTKISPDFGPGGSNRWRCS
jgi:hypothetical protein